ncbi:MAG: hypothetical protein ABIH23_28045 [bacterium]
MKLSQHAQTRCKQRGIPLGVADLIPVFGEPKRRAGGAWEYHVSHKQKSKIIADLKRLIQCIDKMPGTVVIESENGETITVYHRLD